GVPLNIAAAGAIGAGTTAVGHGIFRAVAAASGDSAVNPVQKQEGIDRGDGRDDYGKYASGNGGDRIAANKEEIGLKDVEDRFGVEVIRDKVRASVDGTDKGRFYDGLFKNADGTYTAIEVKSGGASPTASQREFDGLVSADNPARAMLHGKLIEITRVIPKEVP
ncbi:hypothetical protein N136_02978, partial [Leifsonia aquatica ATCC 14665]